eukprot:CAMPEP_0172571156 /NCGR_PEP_ID=MMETSP1067-20121228/130233_1 /TAXON_ID=265564 ORGANISM="Thalassiosira punctigera, Strain Tpunct2005C2" /NCGR_SAMPLE_ID=MMETSP1067 /ASSEMBLY_ACC=CAM_ASM_000444 /LENGTH=61 /DNA_ID=CAMNT_0013363409 /DNA_START=148 /DNA_END=329 /DNA_ORIENTATION=-
MMCGYAPEDMLGDPTANEIVRYDPARLGSLVENLCDDDMRGAFEGEECAAEPDHPEDSDDG